jgi:hypothetical protein
MLCTETCAVQRPGLLGMGCGWLVRLILCLRAMNFVRQLVYCVCTRSLMHVSIVSGSRTRAAI